MKNHLLTLATVLSVGLVSVASAQFSANFETDQSANFTVVIGGTTNDANANFAYASSAHVQGAGAAITIGPAPSGSSTTNVLRLNANLADATGNADSVTVFPNVGTAFSNYEFTFDAWQNYNGGAGGGTGSTNFILIGAAETATVAAQASTNPGGALPSSVTTANNPAINGTGFYFGLSGEGGAGQDYRYYQGSTTITRNEIVAAPDTSFASFFGGANPNFTTQTNLDNGSTGPAAFFTSPTFESAGTMGKAWVTFRLSKFGTDVTLAAKRVGDTGFTTVATATNVPASANIPLIAFSDINTGLATPVADQFVLVDNVSYSILASAETSWSLYQ